MYRFMIFVTSITYFFSLASALTSQKILQDLQAALSSESLVLLSSNTSFGEYIIPRWDIYNPPTFEIAVKPALISDVQIVINYAAVNHISFLTTGRGHGYTRTLGDLRNGLSLDMGNFNTIEFHSEENLMTIGGSVESSLVASALQNAGKELPVGQCTCVGFTGFTLGGGIGPYSGIYGPASDSVSSFEMVTGTGEIVTASHTQNPDLFWGMKGAGFNFGVVTSVTYNIYKATNGGQAMNADMTFHGSQNGTIWTLAKSFVNSQPKELSISLEISYSTTLGEIVVIANFIYAGSEEVGKKIIQPFLDLQPFDINITTIPWNQIPSSALYGVTSKGCGATGVNYVPYSLNLYEIDVNSLVNVVNFMNSSFTTSSNLQTGVIALAQYSKSGFQRFSEDSSAFPYRDVAIFAQIDGFATEASLIPEFIQWGEKIRSILYEGSGKSQLEVYINFAHGDEGEVGWYTTSKLDKLHLLKSRYDPNSLFGFYNPVLSNHL